MCNAERGGASVLETNNNKRIHSWDAGLSVKKALLSLSKIVSYRAACDMLQKLKLEGRPRRSKGLNRKRRLALCRALPLQARRALCLLF